MTQLLAVEDGGEWVEVADGAPAHIRWTTTHLKLKLDLLCDGGQKAGLHVRSHKSWHVYMISPIGFMHSKGVVCKQEVGGNLRLGA